MMMFKRRKDGGLNLSIQAIVILVMAMAVLGLGLALVRNVFFNADKAVIKAIDNSLLENPASAQNPVTVDRNVEFRIGKKAKVEMGFYNSGTESLDIQPTL